MDRVLALAGTSKTFKTRLPLTIIMEDKRLPFMVYANSTVQQLTSDMALLFNVPTDKFRISRRMRWNDRYTGQPCKATQPITDQWAPNTPLTKIGITPGCEIVVEMEDEWDPEDDLEKLGEL